MTSSIDTVALKDDQHDGAKYSRPHLPTLEVLVVFFSFYFVLFFPMIGMYNDTTVSLIAWYFVFLKM